MIRASEATRSFRVSLRRRVLDDRVEGLADDLHRLGTDAFAVLENGLRNYATKASPDNRISESSLP